MLLPRLMQKLRCEDTDGTAMMVAYIAACLGGNQVNNFFSIVSRNLDFILILILILILISIDLIVILVLDQQARHRRWLQWLIR